MSATMASQGDRVQLEQSNVCPPLNIGKMANEGFSCSAIEETKYLIKKSLAEVRKEKMRGVNFPGHANVIATIETHPAMLCQNHTAGYLPCPNGTGKHPEPWWGWKRTAVPPLDRRRLPTPQQTPLLLSTPPAPTSNNAGDQRSKSSICPPDMDIPIYLFHLLNFYSWCICQGQPAWYRFWS